MAGGREDDVARGKDELNTTSYALLGMLAIRPWTTYELAKQMDRGLGRMWPRARSNLFNEPKKLVAHGLAVATGESTGRRPRTVYAITERGRAALREWLGVPGAGPVLEFEGVVKIFFADHSDRESVLAALRDIRRWANERQAENRAIAGAYLAGTGPFPERTAVLALTGRFLTDFADMIDNWAGWASTVVEGWPDDPKRAEPDWSVFRSIAGCPEDDPHDLDEPAG